MTWLARLKKTTIGPDTPPAETTKTDNAVFAGTPASTFGNSGAVQEAANDTALAPDFPGEAFEERAAIMEHDGGLNRLEAEALAAACVQEADPDSHCWPHSSAMNTLEIDTFMGRVERFTRDGLDYAAAQKLADLLVIRDREGDDRRLCLECSHLSERGRCLAAAMGRVAGADRRLEPVTTILQRCEAFGLRKGC